MTPLFILVALFLGFLLGYIVGVKRTDIEAASIMRDIRTRTDAALEETRTDCRRQIAHAFEQSSKSIDQARAAIIDARAAMRDAIEMSKMAAKAIFPTITEDDGSKPGTVGANDRQAAIKAREERRKTNA